MEQTDVKTCPTCDKSIEATKFRLHEASCARNNYKCDKCGEMVNKGDKEHHEEEFHKKVTCQYCKDFEGEKRLIAKHEQECIMKPKQCLYCEMQCQVKDYNQHIQFCGSKTKKCEECNQNVLVRDLDRHQLEGECQINQTKQQEKVQKELEQFQQQEKQTLEKKKQEAERKQQEERKRQRYEQQMQRPAQQKPTQGIAPSSGTERQYIKKSTKQTSLPQNPPQATAQQPSDKVDYDADQELIAKLMEEDENERLAKQLQEEMYSTRNQFNQASSEGQQQIPGEDDDPSIRPPTDIYQDQMIPSAGGMRSYQQFSSFPGGGFSMTSSSYQQFPQPQPTQFQQPTSVDEPMEEFDEPEYATHYQQPHQQEQPDEESELQKAIQESMRQQQQQQQHHNIPSSQQQQPLGGQDVDESEDAIMKQILEQSKSEK